jgi:hypothetical protein
MRWTVDDGTGPGQQLAKGNMDIADMSITIYFDKKRELA